ncbi:MAG: tetrathionate reductase family octaheme c-type cytochrome [Proteobacteria bacterium]|nr:tetrathionate reductase family octaheme c-type cytochrome [Pseudomonadota bacterium]
MKNKTFIMLFSTVLGAWLSVWQSDLCHAAQMGNEKRQTTTDHSKHKVLQQEFSTGDDITKACLSCHTETDSQFHKTIHWTWIAEEGEKQLGKGGDSLNNYCISSNKMNDKGCSKCHTGWNAKEGEVNCLLCHSQKEVNWDETFEDFRFFKEEGDDESKALAAELQGNIHKAVTDIGLPTRKNCGSCHFFGGGGDGVKHGDLDSSLTHPDKMLDVHMGTNGGNFTCFRCHSGKLHNIPGRIYSQKAYEDRRSLVEDDTISKITCESCHTATPHKENAKMNDHTDKVACQACHIPDFARVNPTKMSWDWSKSGRLKDGKPYKTKGPYDKENYLSIKGEMKWEKNVKPEYFWFNGSMSSLTTKDVIDPSTTVAVSQPNGNINDPDSRIFPFKIHHGVQPYDLEYKTLLAPLLSGKDGYWTTLDWQNALQKGMDFSGVPFSGKFDFVKSTFAYPTTHMVMPKANALACTECHVRTNSRLASFGELYMPGRDYYKEIDFGGWILVFGAFAGILLHGTLRFFSGKRK